MYSDMLFYIYCFRSRPSDTHPRTKTCFIESEILLKDEKNNIFISNDLTHKVSDEMQEAATVFTN